MTETACGHPNHGAIDHDCAPFVMTLDEIEAEYGLRTYEDSEPAETALRLVAEVRSLRAALNFARGTIRDLAATVERLENENG